MIQNTLLILLALCVPALSQGPPHIVHETPPSNEELDMPTNFQFDADMEAYGQMLISLDLTKEGGLGFKFMREQETRDIRVDFKNNKMALIQDTDDCSYSELDLLTNIGIEITLNKLNQDKFKPLSYSHTEIIEDEKYYVYEYNMMALIVLQNMEDESPDIELLFAHDKGASGKHTLAFIRIEMKQGVADLTLTVPLKNEGALGLREDVGVDGTCEDSGMNEQDFAEYIQEEMSNWLF